MSPARRGPAPSLMVRAVGLLARREHSRVELGRKLQRYLEADDDPAEIERVLDQLQQQKLLSDARFAAALVRQRSPRYGDLRLTRDLRDRGVSEADADTAMALVDALPTNGDERGRQGRYLQTRGFSMDAITRVLAGKVDPVD